MKKLIGLFLVGCLTLFGCSTKSTNHEKEFLKVGYLSGEGGVEDGSFSQLTWEGIKEFQSEHDGVEIQYVTPKDTSTSELLNNIDNLVMSGNEVVVASGFASQEAIEQASEIYKDTKFIIIDGVVERDNVVSIAFAENEAGFLAGVATALESQTGKVGYLGGIDVPAVVSYGLGYVSGVAYANAHFDTNVEVSEYVYSGTFTDFNVGQMLSAGMFDKGVDIIMATAGVATQGAIAEAKQRDNVYIVGCDSDQYSDGLQKDESSVVLTSAMKRIDVAVKDVLVKCVNGEFPGGKSIMMTLSTEGVGLPSENPNLSESTIGQVNEVIKVIKDGNLQVPSTVEELHTFLDEYNYHVEGVEY